MVRKDEYYGKLKKSDMRIAIQAISIPIINSHYLLANVSRATSNYLTIGEHN